MPPLIMKPLSEHLLGVSPPFNIRWKRLLFLAAVLVPLHMCAVVTMLLVNPKKACEAENFSLTEEVQAKQR